MRVLIARSDGPGGVANYYRTLQEHLGEEYRFFVIHDPSEQRMFFKLLKFLKRLPLFVRRVRGSDVVLLNPSLNAKSFLRDAVLLLVVRAMRRRAVVFFRGWSDRYLETVRTCLVPRLLWDASYLRADAFIVLGSVIKEKLRGLMGDVETPIYVETTVAEGPRQCESTLRERTHALDRELRCLFLSRLVEAKGVLEAIDLYERIKRRIVDRKVTLTIAGDGPLKGAAENYVRDNSVEDVHFSGYVVGEEKLQLYQRSHLLLFPSSYGEGLPNVVLEAMLQGLVIVTTPVGGIPDNVFDGENGILLDLDALDEAADRVVATVEEGEVSRIATRNVEKATQRFLPETVSRRLARILEQAAEGL